MAANEERLHDVVEKLDLLEKHIKRHWKERGDVPNKEQINIFHEEFEIALRELKEIYKTMKVFQSDYDGKIKN